MKKILIVSLLCLLLCGCQSNSIKTSGKIKCNDINTILAYENNPKLIDVRTKEEYNEYHLDNAINILNPISCILSSISSFNGFLLTASINKNTIFPPSNGGNGNKFVIPRDNDISASKYTNSTIPCVFDTASEIPIGPTI